MEFRFFFVLWFLFVWIGVGDWLQLYDTMGICLGGGINGFMELGLGLGVVWDLGYGICMRFVDTTWDMGRGI